MTSHTDLWSAYTMALDEVNERLRRICAALTEHSVPFALVGGQAVVLWGSTSGRSCRPACRSSCSPGWCE